MAAIQGLLLVYEYKCNGRNIIPNGLSIHLEEDLVMLLSMNPDVRAVKKAIKPKSTSVDIYKADLMTEEERKAASKNKKKGVETHPRGSPVEGLSRPRVILVPDVVAKGGKEEVAK